MGAPKDNQPLLVVEDFVKHFPLKGTSDVVHAVNGISFELYSGETLAVVGESGSGKTTLGRCILRLEETTSGRIWFAGNEISKTSHRKFRSIRPQLQMVFQDPYDSLDPKRRVRATIAEPIQYWKRLRGAELDKYVEDLAEQVGLRRATLDRGPTELTSGEQQLVSVARALGTDPQLIVLDEPTSMLDPEAAALVLEVLWRLKRERSVSYLFISHDISLVKQISDRVIVMYLGKIVEAGRTSDILADPLHPYSLCLVDAVLNAEVGRHTPNFQLTGEVPSAVHLPPGCALESRCPVARPSCRERVPELLEIGDARLNACFRIQDGSFAPSRHSST